MGKQRRHSSDSPDDENRFSQAKEQQLRATLQQLKAANQQLRAANQQLTASEQQLRAANQQLHAEVAERMRAEREAQHAREYAESIVETMREPLMVLDGDLRVISVNDCFYNTFKVKPDQTQGRLIYELGSQQWDIPSLRELLENILPKNKTFQNFEVKRDFEDIGQKTMLLNARRLEREEGKQKLILLAIEDITERKKAEEERISNQQLRAANQQLTASEQQLRAANEQLIANEQQLSAANQQLRASEQQLRAANEQLIANEQQLSAANQQLRASEQQLRASEQQLRAANQQLQAEVTERKRMEEKIAASLREKEVLLREVHHRVKNNMQIVSSILTLESKHIKNEQALKMFADSQDRIRSMALVHEKLYESKDLARIDFAEYVRSMTGYLSSLHGAGDGVRFSIDIKDILLDINTAIPCGLIINELVSNSLKYAFPKGRKGEIHIGLHLSEDDRFTLTVKDNGVGLPKGMDFRKTESLGLQLVIMLTEQLDGIVEVDKKKGTTFKITFDDPNHNQRSQ